MVGRYNLSLFLRLLAGFGLCWLRNVEVARMDIQKELIAEYDRETANTRKVLEAIPEDADFGWKPHEKSMALGRLAAHVSDTNGDWAVHTLTRDRLDWTPDMNPQDSDDTRRRCWSVLRNRWRKRSRNWPR